VKVYQHLLRKEKSPSAEDRFTVPKKSRIRSSAQTSALSRQKYSLFTVIDYFLLLLLLVLVFLASSYKISGDDDFFWHLATGRYIAENLEVPDKDVFGHVTGGQQWIPFEWGWDLLVYALYNIGGYNIILVFRSLMFCVIFFIYYLLLRNFKVNTTVAVIFLFLLLVAVIDRLSPRPHIFTYLFFAVILSILLSFKYLDRKKYYKWLNAVPVFFLVWSNFHMGVLAGGLILFIFTVCETLIFFKPVLRSKDAEPLQTNELKRLWIVSVLSAVTLLINPHGLETYIYAYNHTQLKMLETVNEWQSPFSDKVDFGFVQTLYKLFLAAGVIVLIYSYIRKDIVPGLLILSFAVYSVRAMRFTVDYELISFFFIVLSINYFLNKLSVFKTISTNTFFSTSVAIFFIYIISQIPSNKIYQDIKYYRIFGWGVNDEFIPVQLFDFMKQHNISGTPYNHFGTGGYLVWNFPDQKNYIDSRNLNDEIFNEYNHIMKMREGFAGILDRRGVDYVIFLDPDLVRRPQDMQYLITNYLNRSPEWKLVFWDDKSMLFLKDLPKFRHVTENYSYRVINPYNAIFHKTEFEEKVRNNPVIARQELMRKSSEEPEGVLYKNIAMVTANILNKINR